ncbi:protein TALPID3-like isoform X1 [Ptychodera flava]|uniref:protein TALPID3-like isoform X1 n=1 Tax=Ptychodera flava TaxID=63121 RepID=UPI003969CBF6
MFTTDRHVHPVTENMDEMHTNSNPPAENVEPMAEKVGIKLGSPHGQSPNVPGLNLSSNTSGSSSASDILIRSTQIEPPSQLVQKLSQLGVSSASISSISSANSSTNGSKKVKLKAKHLREIKSPFGEDGESGATPPPHVPPPLIPVERTRKHMKKPDPLEDGQPIVYSMRPQPNAGNESGSSSKHEVVVSPRDQGEMGDQDSQQQSPSSENDENEPPQEIQVRTVTKQPDVQRTKLGDKQPSTSTFLRQGFPVEGMAFTELSRQQEEIAVSDFRLDGKAKLLRENFFKRPVSNAPVKKIVQPKLITKNLPRVDGETSRQPMSAGAIARNQLASGRDPEAASISSAAAATAAAVAAAAPMLKAQSDVEAKLSTIMEKLTSLEDAKQKAEQQEQMQHVRELEKQVDELTQNRIKHLEELQQQQLQLHAKLFENNTKVATQADAKPMSALQTSTPEYSASAPVLTQHGRKQSQVPHRYQPAVMFHPRIEESPDHVSKPTQTSPLDTPAPRKKPPTPLTSETSTVPKPGGRGLLEEILSPSNNNAVQDVPSPIRVTRPALDSGLDRSPDNMAPFFREQTTAEKQADRLVHDLGQLKRDMKTVLQGAQKLQVNTRNRLQSAKLHEEIQMDSERRDKMLSGPAPIDTYLTKPAVASPITYQAPAKLPGLEETFLNAPVPTSCLDAQNTLHRVRTSRGYLDTNLDVVAHARNNEELYSLIDRMMYDRDTAERAHIRSEVDKMILQINYELEIELQQTQKHSREGEYVPQRDTEPSKTVGKGKTKPTKKKVQAKINTGLRKKTPIEDDTEGKENKPDKPVVKKPQKVGSHMKDEQYLTRVYGKALYHPQRTTEKTGPYLRMKTTPAKPTASRPKLTKDVPAIKMKSSKTQTAPSPKKPKVTKDRPEYYFNPQRDMLSRGVAAAPVPGQLIPMAIPLGEPRIGSGLTQPVVISKSRPAMDTSNVAIIDIKQPEEPPKPQLTVQVLPSVDIDTAPPTPVLSEPIIPSPEDNDNAAAADNDVSIEISKHVSPQPEAVPEPKEEEQEKDLVDGTGISLPGYSERPSEYNGPPFPPQQPPPQVVAFPSSDVLADDIRRRDLLEDRAVHWVEQELMARIISQIHAEDGDQVDVLRPASPVSEATPDSTIVDGMGNAGLQLFVDSGHPVNSDLVNALVREVIEEKLAGMLGQHLSDRHRPLSPPQSPQQPVEEIPREPTPPPLTPRVRVATPEVTPQPSPIHTPPPAAIRSPLDTPDVTPEGSVVMEPEPQPEPETESSVEMREPTPEPIKVPESPVGTPIATPPPTPPPKAPTPPPTPRHSPVEPEPVSPEPVEPRTPSPQPWTHDELPLPEELPDLERKEEPILRPIIVTLEPDIEGGDVIQVTPTIPPPKAQPPPSPPSESSSSSPEPTTYTETSDHDISEGEWLLDRSEGQVLPAPHKIGANTLEAVYGRPTRQADDSLSSPDSTLHETEDIDKDTTQLEPASEGEVLAKKMPVHRDPMVTLLARLNQQADYVMPTQSAASHLKPRQRPSDSDVSVGEVSLGQRPSLIPPAERVMYGQSREPRKERQGPHMRQVETGSPGEVEFSSGDARDKPLRVSELESPKSGKSPKSASKSSRSPKSPRSSSQKTPSRVIHYGGGPESPKGAAAESMPTGGGRVIVVGGKSDSPPPASKGRVIQVGVKEPQEQEDGVPGGTLSDLGTRTMTPDQMNLDGLLQSGYLSQTFSQSDGADAGAGEADELKIQDGLITGGSAPGTLLVTLPSADENEGYFYSESISDVSEISAGDV